MPTLYHYIFIRQDLPSGTRLAQVTHAAGESVRFPVLPGAHAVVIDVPDERSLLELSQKLNAADVRHHMVLEPDAPYSGQAMAIGCEPTYDRTKIRRLTSHLPLAR